MGTLIQKVRSHVTGQKTSGQNTLALTVETIEHMRDHGDWTPLAYLIGRSQPAQSTMVRKIAGKTLQGFTMKKDKDQPSGLKIVKLRGKNQGFDETTLNKVGKLVEEKKSIQSEDVKKLFNKTPQTGPKEWNREAVAKRIAASLEKVAETYGVPVNQIIDVADTLRD